MVLVIIAMQVDGWWLTP
jgi:hypothetical protein